MQRSNKFFFSFFSLSINNFLFINNLDFKFNNLDKFFLKVAIKFFFYIPF